MTAQLLATAMAKRISKPAAEEHFPSDAAECAAQDGASGPSLRTYRSEDLFQGENQVVIVHEGKEYRLRSTRNGKLILYK